MPDIPSEEFVFSCPQCSYKQSIPVSKKGAAIVCQGCKSTVFVPSDQSGDESDDEYGLSAEWEARKPAVPVYAAEDASPVSPRAEEEDTVREPVEKKTKEEDEEEEEGYRRPDLPKQPMWTGVLGFLATKEAIALAIGLTVAATVVSFFTIAGLVYDNLGTTGEGEAGPVGIVLAWLAVGTLGLAWAIWASVSSLTVVQETAAGFDRIDGLPEFVWMEWVANALFIFTPLAAAAVAGKIVATVLPFGTVFWISVFAFFLFPILLLSALETQFWVGFHSVRVYRSLTTVRGAWGILYLYQFVLACVLLLGFAIARSVNHALVGSSSWVVGVNILGFFLAAAGVVALLIYARVLGRLVWIISETEKAGLREEEEDEEKKDKDSHTETTDDE